MKYLLVLFFALAAAACVLKVNIADNAAPTSGTRPAPPDSAASR